MNGSNFMSLKPCVAQRTDRGVCLNNCIHYPLYSKDCLSSCFVPILDGFTTHLVASDKHLSLLYPPLLLIPHLIV